MITPTLQELMDEIGKWSSEQFKGQTAVSKLHHLKKEVPELIEAIEINEKTPFKDGRKNILFEFADNLMLLLDAANKQNITADTLISFTVEKLAINKKREWHAPDENGVYLHVKKGLPEGDKLPDPIEETYPVGLTLLPKVAGGIQSCFIVEVETVPPNHAESFWHCLTAPEDITKETLLSMHRQYVRKVRIHVVPVIMEQRDILVELSVTELIDDINTFDRWYANKEA